MKFKSYFIVVASFFALVFSSCKKEEKTMGYMDGPMNLKCEIPSFVTPGDRYEIKADGVTAPDGTAVAYYFSSTATGSKKDTVMSSSPTYVFEVPDTLGSFSFTVSAFPVESSDKYYVTTASIYFDIVKDDPENGSLTDIPAHEDDMIYTLHGRNYNVCSIGGNEWIRANLSYIERDAAGKEVFGRSYAGSPAMQNLFGAFYTWEEAQKACPEGWRLPSESDWVNLLKASGAPDSLKPFQDSPSGAGSLMVKARFNGELLWLYYRGVNITDKSISVLPVGYAVQDNVGWTYIGSQAYAAIWTSDEYEGKGVYRYIYKENDNVYVGTADKSTFAASVRCIR